jgi:hypothetical protein
MAKWLTRWSAKPVFMGSNPIRCSINQHPYIESVLSISPPAKIALTGQKPSWSGWIAAYVG